MLEERVRIEADADQVGNFGEDRRPEGRRDPAHYDVGCRRVRRRSTTVRGPRDRPGRPGRRHRCRVGRARCRARRRFGPHRRAARSAWNRAGSTGRPRPPTAGRATASAVHVSSTAPSPPARTTAICALPSSSVAAAARTATSTRSSRSPASMARNRRSVATVSGGGSGTRARGWEPRSRSLRRAATSASTPADRSAASPTPIGDADPGTSGGVASAGPGSTGGGTDWRSVVVVASAGAATSSGEWCRFHRCRRRIWDLQWRWWGRGLLDHRRARQPLPPRVVLAACRWRGS